MQCVGGSCFGGASSKFARAHRDAARRRPFLLTRAARDVRRLRRLDPRAVRVDGLRRQQEPVHAGQIGHGDGHVRRRDVDVPRLPAEVVHRHRAAAAHHPAPGLGHERQVGGVGRGHHRLRRRVQLHLGDSAGRQRQQQLGRPVVLVERGGHDAVARPGRRHVHEQGGPEWELLLQLVLEVQGAVDPVLLDDVRRHGDADGDRHRRRRLHPRALRHARVAALHRHHPRVRARPAPLTARPPRRRPPPPSPLRLRPAGTRRASPTAA